MAGFVSVVLILDIKGSKTMAANEVILHVKKRTEKRLGQGACCSYMDGFKGLRLIMVLVWWYE
jgi:hypothetical protein